MFVRSYRFDSASSSVMKNDCKVIWEGDYLIKIWKFDVIFVVTNFYNYTGFNMGVCFLKA